PEDVQRLRSFMPELSHRYPTEAFSQRASFLSGSGGASRRSHASSLSRPSPKPIPYLERLLLFLPDSLFILSTSENCSFFSASSPRSSITVTLSPIENSRRVRWPIILRTFS